MAPSADDIRRKKQAEKEKEKDAKARALDEVMKRGYVKSNLDEIGEDGETPFLTAAKNGNMEGLELLFKAGADVQARDKRGFTAVLIACDRGMLSTVQKLIQLIGIGIIQEKDPRGCSPLWIAAAGGNVECIRFLAEKEGKWTMTETNARGETPLFGAARAGKMRAVEYLANQLQGDAMLQPASSGQTPFQVAAENGHIDVVKMMMHISSASVLDDDALVGAKANDWPCPRNNLIHVANAPVLMHILRLHAG